MTPNEIIDFVRGKKNTLALAAAVRQQKQLSYFTQSHIQEDITMEYLEQWANRKYAGTDFFLTWVKMIFRTDNFLSFYKYLRHPLPSARLVNDNIKLQLKRVFNSEDSYFRYVISNKEVPPPDILESDKFTNELFEAILFRHNDILFTDLKDINTPTRYFVHIEHVVALESDCSKIERIAFVAKMEINEKPVYGYLYADEERYQFYDREYNLINDVPHDLGECPADYISLERFPYKHYEHSDVVRKGIFSYVKTDLEEYVFLKTLQKMTEPNGALPVAVQLNTKEISADGLDKKGISDKEPTTDNVLGSQQARLGSQVTGSNSVLQAGTIIKAPVMTDAEGKVNMDVVTNFLTFFYAPPESLTYINERIKEITSDIISAVLGDFSEANESAKNELQVGKSYVSKEDKLRDLSKTLSVARTKSDTKFLSLKYGPGRVSVSCFFGSDFFMETQADLYDRLKVSPNPIESRKVLLRLSRNQNMHNPANAKREMILYNLLPYANTSDFTTALAQGVVQPEDIAMQTRFNYWIDRFEAEYGDILSFYEAQEEEKDSTKIVLINNLIKQIINESKSVRTPESVQGAGTSV